MAAISSGTKPRANFSKGRLGPARGETAFHSGSCGRYLSREGGRAAPRCALEPLRNASDSLMRRLRHSRRESEAQKAPRAARGWERRRRKSWKRSLTSRDNVLFDGSHRGPEIFSSAFLRPRDSTCPDAGRRVIAPHSTPCASS